MQAQGSDRNPSSSSSSNSSNGSNLVACSISGPSKRSLDLLIRYLDDVLSVIIDKGPHSKRNDSEIKLKDTVQPLASDFSKLLEGISQGANIFSDQSSTSKLSSEVESVALDLMKGLGKAHWVAAGLLAIANVLERFDKISSNDRECTDLLRGMLDLGKLIKQLKDNNVDFHREILEKMKEAVHLVVSGAILCHSFITCSKISKFLLTAKIREELVYVRGKVDRIKQDLNLQLGLLILSSVTFHMPWQKRHNDNEGGTEETSYPTEGFALQQCNLGGANIHCEIEETCETQTHKMEVQSDSESCLSASNGQVEYGSDTESCLSESNGQVEYGCYKEEVPSTNNSERKNRNQPKKFLPRFIPRPARMLESIAHGLKKITGHKFEGREMVDENQLLSFAIEHGFGWLPIRFSIQELEMATNGFQCKLGAGGVGSVFKGILADGRQVAVKVNSTNCARAKEEFMYELACTANLHHRNILKLVGFCIAREKLMLVYDYMPNGSLSGCLLSPIKKQHLDWRMRFNIIVEIISGLAYLHGGAYVHIVHRDIKPSNILLDENFSAKISDFGLAIALQDNVDEYETNLAGTVGYIDPEYLHTCRLTEKTDIYSFGILVLEVVSGKRYLDFTSVENELGNLAERALMLLKENRISDLIDPELVKGPGFDLGDILRVIMIALLCIQKQSGLRPPASQVWVMLSTKEVRIPTAPEVNDFLGSSFDSSSPSSLLDGDDESCSL